MERQLQKSTNAELLKNQKPESEKSHEQNEFLLIFRFVTKIQKNCSSNKKIDFLHDSFKLRKMITGHIKKNKESSKE